MARAAAQWLAALDDRGRAKASYAFDDTAERWRWHWTTPGGFPRHGLPFKEMNQTQRDLALALFRTGVSEAGYQKALAIMGLQRDLGNDPDLYYVTVFGTPSDGAPWAWRFEGHHLSRHITVAGERVAMMPVFLGAWPTASRAGVRAMQREEEAGRELASALAGKAREAGIFQARTLTQHLTGNRAHVTPLPTVGIGFGELSDGQQGLVREIVQTYLGTLPEGVATPLLDAIGQAGLEQVRFGWAGSLTPRQPHYYRLQGPTFLLEFDNSRNGGTHIHSVWRDFKEDFGQHLA
jgi:hypothetical protein